MRFFYFDTDKKEDPLTLLLDTANSSFLKPPSRHLDFPVEIIEKIVGYLPRSSLSSVASINQLWYSIAMGRLYKHIYICTLPHWLRLVHTFSNTEFATRFAPCIQSIVLKPSPKLIPSQLTSSLNQRVVENDDTIQPYLRGYVRLQRVDYDLTGLEGLLNEEEENQKEVDTTQKEAEWLFHVKDAEMVTLLRYASQLEYLHVSGCENLTDRVLSTIATAKLQQEDRKPMIGLWMSILRKCTPAGIRQLIATEQELHLEKKLKYLDIGFQVSMNDESIEDITSYWSSSLTHLRLNSIYQLSDTSIISIGNHCPNLRLLHLVRCWRINNPSLKFLAQRCKKLKFASVSFLSRTDEEGIKYLIQLCPELAWIDITGCSINSLFKSVILEGWKAYRAEHHLPPVHFEDGSLNLL